MIGLTRLAKPALGDTFVRSTTDGGKEEAIVVSILHYPNKVWRANLVTESGWDHLTDALEMCVESEWRPADWTVDPITGTYKPKDTCWDVEKSAWVKGEAKVAAPRPPAPTNLPT